jgi:hypothetical protein
MKLLSIRIIVVVAMIIVISSTSATDTTRMIVLAQKSSVSSSSLSKLTDGGSIGIKLEPSPIPIKAKAQTQLKVSFLKPNTEQIQPHIDYDLIIIDNSTGEAIFQASNQTGQAGVPLHTAESIVTIPFTFSKQGEYAIRIPVYGILFNPIAPESATFTIHVG